MLEFCGFRAACNTAGKFSHFVGLLVILPLSFSVLYFSFSLSLSLSLSVSVALFLCLLLAGLSPESFIIPGQMTSKRSLNEIFAVILQGKFREPEEGGVQRKTVE